MSSPSPNVTTMPQRGVECLSLRRIDKGALVAFCDLKIVAWNLTLHDCKWFRKEGNEWVGLPSSSFTNRDGKTIYKDLVSFADKDAAERFKTAALTALKSYSGPG